MKCKCCNIEEAVKYSKYSSGEFCSRECSRAFSTKNKREEINKKIAESRTGSGNGSVTLACKFCGGDFEVEWKRRGQKFCSRSCNKSFQMSQGNIASEMGKLSSLSQSKFRRSKNEIYFAEMCIEYFDEVLTNTALFNGWDADIVIKDIKVAVLWNGRWHYEKITEQHSVNQVQNRDRIKMMEIEKHGYKPYVIKDMGKKDFNFVEKEFKKFIDYLKQNNYICV